MLSLFKCKIHIVGGIEHNHSLDSSSIFDVQTKNTTCTTCTSTSSIFGLMHILVFHYVVYDVYEMRMIFLQL